MNDAQSRRAAIEAMVDRAMEKAIGEMTSAIAGCVVEYDDGTERVWPVTPKPMVGDYVADYSEPDLEAWRAPDPELESLLRNSSPIRLTPEQKREKANAYMRAYKERKKAEKERGP